MPSDTLNSITVSPSLSMVGTNVTSLVAGSNDPLAGSVSTVNVNGLPLGSVRYSFRSTMNDSPSTAGTRIFVISSGSIDGVPGVGSGSITSGGELGTSTVCTAVSVAPS